MLNKYPWYTYLLVAVALLFTGLYALPNLYGEDPAVQVSISRGGELPADTQQRVEKLLSDAQIAVKSVVAENNQILVRFNNQDDQLSARTAIEASLEERFVVALNLAPATPNWLKGINAAPMKLGLDLRGGVHFLMEVDMDAALAKSYQGLLDEFRDQLKEERVYYAGARQEKDAVIVRFRDEESRAKAKDLFNNQQGLLIEEVIADERESLRVSFTDTRLKEIRDYAVEQNVTIIRNRINELGVAEPVVQRQGAERIVVQLPGIQDTARAKEILGATATLEFRLVDQEGDVQAAVAGRVPANSELYNDRNGQPVLLQKRTILSGEHINNAQSGRDEYSRSQVNIRLDSAGGSKMSRATKDNIGKPMATLFIEYKPSTRKDANGKTILERHAEVINIATIQAQLGSSFRITGIDSPGEAHNLALLLRAGALIAPIQIVEERTVGPSLGQQNIDNGMLAMMIGLAAVMVMMAVYYRVFGLIANAALLANLVMVVGLMSMIPGATLSLPGIAGLVLTVGMAVDANVLIFERIREEIRDGISVQQAIHRGYANAFSTIADANITTLITAIILFAVGTGPIKGFAVTLAIGIATSMFTAIIGSRCVVNLIWGGKRVNKLPI